MDVLIRNGKGEDTQTQSGEGHGKTPVKTESETEGMPPPARKCLQPPEAGRGKVGFTLRAFRGSMVLLRTWISDFSLPDL